MNRFFSTKDCAIVFSFNGLVLAGIGFFIYLLADFGDPPSLEIRLQNERMGKIIFVACILLFLFMSALAILWATNHRWPGYPILIISFLHLIGSGLAGYFVIQFSPTLSFVFLLICIIDAVIIWSVARTLYGWKQPTRPLPDQYSS